MRCSTTELHRLDSEGGESGGERGSVKRRGLEVSPALHRTDGRCQCGGVKWILLMLSLAVPAPALAAPEAAGPKTATLAAEELAGVDELSGATKALLRTALSVTARGLAYKAGSADPDTGGTDCSGFVYHVLQKQGVAGVPRQSNGMYEWVWKAGTFRACNGRTMESFEFQELRPGDLLFWVNSTKDSKTDRDPPVTHVMIYLGKRRSDGHPVVAGASDGRTYDGQRMSGVSVFDFRLPSPESAARFIGYAHLPAAKSK